MATYLITFADNDPHSPRNGAHMPVASGAAFIAEYGDELAILHSEVGRDDDCIAAAIDALAIGESIRLEGGWGEVITIERACDGTAPEYMVDLIAHGETRASDCLGDFYASEAAAHAAGKEALACEAFAWAAAYQVRRVNP